MVIRMTVRREKTQLIGLTGESGRAKVNKKVAYRDGIWRQQARGSAKILKKRREESKGYK